MTTATRSEPLDGDASAAIAGVDVPRIKSARQLPAGLRARLAEATPPAGRETA